MKKLIYFTFIILASCTKTQERVVYPAKPVPAWQVIRATSTTPGSFCIGGHPKYDTIRIDWDLAMKGPVRQDSIVEGQYYYTYFVKKIK